MTGDTGPLLLVGPGGVAAEALADVLVGHGRQVVSQLASDGLQGLTETPWRAVLLGPVRAVPEAWEEAAAACLVTLRVPIIAFGEDAPGLARVARAGLASAVLPMPCAPDAACVVVEAALVQHARAARVEDELATSLALKRAILHETPAVVYAKDRDLRFLLSNTRHAALVGRPQDDIIGLTDVDLFGEGGTEIEALSRQVLESGEPQTSEFELPLANGLRYFHETIFPIRADSGRLIGVAGIATDLTEVRHQQLMVEKLRATFQIMLDASPVALLLLELDGRVALANEAAGHILARTSLIGTPFSGLVPDLDLDSLGSQAHERPRSHVDVELVLPDGGTRPAELRASRVDLPDGGALLVSLVDLTVRKVTEERLREAQQHAEVAARAKGAFLAHMSHEIRTPMNAVLGFAQLLERDASLGPTQLERVRTILRAGDHLLTLVNQVLDMSVIEAGRVDIQRELVLTEDLLDSVLEMFQNRAVRARIWLRSELGGGVPRAFLGDEGKMRQILVNLVGNAVRIVKQGGVTLRLEVCRDAAAPTLRMHVVDTGPGIPPEDQARIFGAFEQAGSSSARGGAGLGLSISHRYAELMGGSLSVESTVGEGTTFTLTLPLEGAIGAFDAPEPLAPVARGRSLGRRPRVLAVDDEPDNRTLLAQMLEADGFDVTCVPDGAAALAAVQAEVPDLVVMDYRMPGMDGLQATAALRTLEPPFHGPVLLLTASVFEQLDERAIRAGANRYLRKPVKRQDLLNAACELLDIDPPAAAGGGTEGPVEAAAGAPEDIPAALASQLREAVEQCDYGRLMALAQGVAASHPNLSRVAAAAAASFDYTDLSALLDAAGTA
ncbi:MAG: ATP-binding protein [Candidatus Sericytochromatia bacterium]|nr:ATP-binding protein [Candidatus Sericytochromatia bacterium]